MTNLEAVEYLKEIQKLAITNEDKEAFDLAINALNSRRIAVKRIGIKLPGKDPYQEAGDIVEKWCEKNYYGSVLVSLSINGREETEFLSFDGNTMSFTWNTDWWEGETNIRFLGLRPLNDIVFYGIPNLYEED